MSDTIWGNIFKKYTEKDELSFLKSVALFEDFSLIDLSKIHKILHPRKYHLGEVVFKEQDPGHSMYIIKKGCVKILCEAEDKRERELAILEKGHFFGEMSVVDDVPRTATAIALDETELYGFLRADLLNLIDRDPRLASAILLKLSLIVGTRLRETNRRLNKCVLKEGD